MLVCGIDPGLNNTGYGVIEVGESGRQAKLIEAGVIRTSANDPLPLRLAELEEAVSSVLGEHKPEMIGLEELYSHYRHPRTAILMGHARGVLLLVAAKNGATVMPMPANRVKATLTGNGHASKEQMQRAIMATLGLRKPPDPPDVADALAIALCAGIQSRVDSISQAGRAARDQAAGKEAVST